MLIGVGSPGSRKTAPVASPTREAAPPSSVSANGFTLASTSVDLPADNQMFPDAPHAEVINANCTSCHSASMAMTQPRLSAEQWKATVTKMREVYKAPVAEQDVPAIVAYLTAMPGQGQPEPPETKTAPGTSG